MWPYVVHAFISTRMNKESIRRFQVKDKFLPIASFGRNQFTQADAIYMVTHDCPQRQQPAYTLHDDTLKMCLYSRFVFLSNKICFLFIINVYFDKSTH
ncbi:hypothetical protein LIA77_02767 [Sarocladium implicatum]|nr:hypothetical protein LIA77_02767 [Sarocladium implicatum]